LKKAETLRGHGSFDRVFSRGRRLAGTLVQCVFLLEVSDHPSLRAGYAVPHKAYHAVRRNRFRRLMREAYRLESSSLRSAVLVSKVSADLVFLFRPRKESHVERVTLHPIRAEIAGFCQRIRERVEEHSHA
jgi:ribonuclease P protein component